MVRHPLIGSTGSRIGQGTKCFFCGVEQPDKGIVSPVIGWPEPIEKGSIFLSCAFCSFNLDGDLMEQIGKYASGLMAEQGVLS